MVEKMDLGKDEYINHVSVKGNHRGMTFIAFKTNKLNTLIMDCGNNSGIEAEDFSELACNDKL